MHARALAVCQCGIHCPLDGVTKRALIPRRRWLAGPSTTDEDWSYGDGYYLDNFGDIDENADIGVVEMPYQVCELPILYRQRFSPLLACDVGQGVGQRFGCVRSGVTRACLYIAPCIAARTYMHMLSAGSWRMGRGPERYTINRPKP